MDNRRIIQVVDLARKPGWMSCDDNQSQALGCPSSLLSCHDEKEFTFLRMAIKLAKRYHYGPILILLIGMLVLGIIVGVALAPMIMRMSDRVSLFWIVKKPSRNSKKWFDQEMNDLLQKEDCVRRHLLSNEQSAESSIMITKIPHHVAVIMDGNRRYGRSTGTDGHWEGARKLLEFSQWCLEYKIQQATVFCFSTENWQRDASEVASLLSLVTRYCAQELKEKAIERRIRIRVHSTYRDPLPDVTVQALNDLEAATDVDDPALTLHLCISYGSRSEIAQAANRIAQRGCDVTEDGLDAELLVSKAPDILIRTAGEVRLSNFLLWQAAYTELFFVQPTWPALSKRDFESVLEQFGERQRRFGT